MKHFTVGPRPPAWAGAIAGLVLASAAWAQSYPTRPVHVVIPLSPGGTTDVPGRIIAQKLSEKLGQQFFVENRAGAGGTIGSDFVAKSKPDGYTLLLTASPFVIAPHVYKSVPYNALADFAPVIRVASGPYVLVVHPSLGVRSVKELIAAAKKQPGKIDFASSGNGGAQHLVTELFMYMAGIKLNHVPYKGSGPAVADLVGGRVQVTFDAAPSLIAHVRSGKLRVLAAASAERNRLLPDVPTFAELGYPQINVSLWYGLLAPAGTPRPVIDKLNGALGEILKAPEVVERLHAQGAEPMRGTPDAFASFMRTEMAKWAPVVRQANVKAE